MMAAQETPSERVSRQNVDRTRWEKLDPPEKVTEDCVLWADDKDDILERSACSASIRPKVSRDLVLTIAGPKEELERGRE